MANRELKDRGSRKHVLDLIASPRFRIDLDSILARGGFRLADDPDPQPYGRVNADAWAEFEVEEYFGTPHRQLPDLPLIADDWWIIQRANNNRRPGLDLIARLQSRRDDGFGILLVEAKAHVSEAKIRDAKTAPSSSAESISNDARIRRRIKETSTALNRLGCGTTYLSTQDHYQLANRLAYSVHLASLGYGVVLLYLGFLGDTYFNDPLTDRNHWQRVMGGYQQGVVPQMLPEQPHTIGNGTLFMAVDSFQVIDVPRRAGGMP
jgi:hypothetical protein